MNSKQNEQMNEHSWEITFGVINYRCIKCGSHGYLPAKEMEAGIKSSDDCDHKLISSVLDD